MNHQKQHVTIANGETLAYLKIGSGSKTLVLIHGNLSSSVHWLPFMERLSNDYTMYAFDLRGMGDSSYHQRFDTLDTLAHDVMLALTMLGVSQYAVIGWSAGGGIAMILASQDARVQKLVLLSSMSYRGLPVYQKDQDGKMIIGKTYPNKDALALDRIQVMPILDAQQKQDAAYMDWLWQKVIYTVKKPEASLNQILIHESLKQRNLVDLDWAIMHLNLGAGKTDYAEGNLAIKRIQVPVLSIWGKQDITVWEFMVRETAFVLGSLCTLTIYDACGHSPIVDQLDRLVSDIKQFIS
jgi:pimeloyl-ACP methyl ester carboxylesterase